MISIRDFRESDYGELSAFFNDEKDFHYSFPRIDYPINQTQMKTVISSRSNQIVLIENDIPVGFTDLYDINEPDECYIGNFIIHKNRRNRGYGAILLKEIISKAAGSLGIRRIRLFCWCENTGALILYKKFGFYPIELIIRDFNGIKVPVLRMEITVDSIEKRNSGTSS